MRPQLPVFLLLASAAVATADTPATQQQSRNLIINGADAQEGRYPYFTTLDHYCGGALIAPDIMITAGHCRPKHVDDVYPYVGRYSFENDLEGLESEIEDIKRHADFVRKGDDEFINDFTLLKLKDASTNPFVRLNRDPTTPYPRQPVMAMGVGSTQSEDIVKADTLQQVFLNYLPNEDCELLADPDREESFDGRIFSSHLCTTGSDSLELGSPNQRDSCAYDSGSPIIIPGKSAEQDVLVGLVSWGEECADPVFAGVNSRISYVIDWIDEFVCERSDDPPADFQCNGPPPTGLMEEHGRFILFILLTAISATIYCIFLRGKKATYFRGPGKTISFDNDYAPVDFSEKSKLYPWSPALTAETRQDSFYSTGSSGAGYDSINDVGDGEYVNRQNSLSP